MKNANVKGINSTMVNGGDVNMTGIFSKTVVEGLSKRILANDRVSFYTVVVDKDAAKMYRVEMPMSRTFRGAKIEDELVMLTRGGSLKAVKKDSKAPATMDYIIVDIDDLKVINSLLMSGIYVVYAGSKTAAYVFNGRTYSNLMDASSVESLEGLGVVRYYRGFNYSPSNIRTVQVIMKDITDGDNREFVLDEISQEAWSAIKDKKMTLIDIIKIAGRFGQANAGSVNMGAIPGWNYFTGKFTNPDENNAESWDGMNFWLDEYVAECFSNRLGIYVAPEAVRGMFIQNRPATMKNAGLVVGPKVFNRILSRLDQSKVMTFGDANNTVLIVDKNGIKADFNMNKGINFEILDFARPSSARLSKQAIAKLLSADKAKTVALLDKLFIEQVVTETASVLVDRKAQIPTIEELTNGYAVDVVRKVAPRYLDMDRAFFTSTARTLIQRFTKAIDKLSYETEGANLRLVADISALLCGRNVLRYGEVFIKEAIKDKAKKAMMVKYPAMGTKEFYVGTVMTMKDIKARLKEMNVSKDEFDAIVDFFASSASGNGVVPAKEVIKAQCAGLDFDFDGGTWFWAPEVIEIVEGVKPEAVIIVNSKTTTSAASNSKLMDAFRAKVASVGGNYSPTCESFMEGFISQVNNGNLSIGEITFINDIINAIAGLEKDEFMAIGKQALVDNVEGAGRGKAKYTGLVVTTLVVDGIEIDVVEVSPALSKKVKEEIIKADLNNYDNMVKIFADLNRLYRMYQELTIDAAKKATKVEIDVMFSTVWANSLTAMKHDFTSFEDKFSVKRVERPKNEDAEDTRLTFDDTMAEVQLRHAQDLADLVNTEIKERFETVGFPAAELAKFERFNFTHKNIMTDISQVVKYEYSVLSMDYAIAMSKFNSKDEEGAEAVKAQYKEEVAVLSNMTRQLLHGMTPADGGRLLKLAAMTGANGTDPHSTNQMALNLAEEMFLAMVLEDYADINVAGYPIVAGAKDLEVGAKIDFVHGAAGNVIIKADFTGELTVHEFDGKLYAVKPIEINNIEPDFSKVAFLVRSAIDVKTGKTASYDELLRILSREERKSLTLRRETAVNGKIVYDAVDYTFTGKSGNDMTKTVARYKTESIAMTELLDGVTGSISTIIPKSVMLEGGKVRNTVLIELDVISKEKTVVQSHGTGLENVDVSSASEEESSDL